MDHSNVGGNVVRCRRRFMMRRPNEGLRDSSYWVIFLAFVDWLICALQVDHTKGTEIGYPLRLRMMGHGNVRPIEAALNECRDQQRECCEKQAWHRFY